MFSGIKEPTAAPSRGGMFDNLGPPLTERASSPMEGGSAARKGTSGGGCVEVGGGGTFLDDAESSPRQSVLRASDGNGGEVSDGMGIGAGSGSSGGYSGLFDSSPPVGATISSSTSSHTISKAGAASSKNLFTADANGAIDEMDDFLSTLDTEAAPAPSGGAGSSATAATTAAVRRSIFGDDEFGGGGGSEDDIFSSAYTSASGRGAASSGGGGSGGGRSNGDSRAGAGAGTSLFDRPTQFSIDSGDDEASNVFGGGGGGGGSSGANVGGGNDDRMSFLTALGDADLFVGGEAGGEGGADREGMVEVML